MGWWQSEHGVTGDTPADILGEAFSKVRAAYDEDLDRDPTQGEVADAIEFVTRGQLQCLCGDANAKFDPDDDNVPTIQPCGRQGVFGDFGPLGTAKKTFRFEYVTNTGLHGMLDLNECPSREQLLEELNHRHRPEGLLPKDIKSIACKEVTEQLVYQLFPATNDQEPT